MNICLHEFEVKGILDGTISEMWRPVKPQPLWIADPNIPFKFPTCNPKGIIKSPFGPVGTRIIGKETWMGGPQLQDICYKTCCNCGHSQDEHDDFISWKSSAIMPSWTSRITLINAGVECKQAREITEDEAKAAGMSIDEDPYWFPTYSDPDSGGYPSYRKSFQYLWDSLYAKKGYPFESAWAWKLKFVAEVKR